MNNDILVDEPLVTVAREMTADKVLEAAERHEQGRSVELEQRLLKATGFATPDIAVTSFEHHALVLGYNAGIVGFEQLERVWSPVSESGRRHDVRPEELKVQQRGLRLEAHATAAIDAHDGMMARFSAFSHPNLLTRRILQVLLGSVYWPDLTEFELVHMARLNNVLTTWHGYWLSEMGRETCPRHSNFDDATVLADCAACAALEQMARSPEVREERIAGDHAAEVATSAVDTLRYEVHAFWHGLMTGRFTIPALDPIDHGQACEYARLHHRRILSPGHALWVDTCLVGDRDYGTCPESYAKRAAGVFEGLVEPAVVVDEATHVFHRSLRTLQDVGRRVALWGQLEGPLDPGHAATVRAIGDLIAGLRASGPTDHESADAVVADALSLVASNLTYADDIVALGYRPTVTPSAEPAASRAAREEAYLKKLDRARSPWAPFFRTSLRGAVTMAIDGPRQTPLSDELNNAVRAAIHADLLPGEVTALSELLYGLSLQWGPDTETAPVATTWYSRLSPTTMPPKSQWARFRVRPNPNLGGCPTSVTVDWLQAVIDGKQDGTTAPPLVEPAVQAHVLVGEGRQGPVMLPYTSARSRLLEELQYSPTLQQLADDGFTDTALEQALDEQLIVLVHSSTPYDLAGFPPIASTLVDLMTPGVFDEGPWADPEQATYYEALCDRGEHYVAVARALVGRVRIRVGDQVADLGCGTGLVTREVLKRLGPEGEVVGLDPASLMVQASRRRIQDERAKFKRGNAHSLVDAMPLGPGFSSVICSSAIWLERSPHMALRAIRRSLRRRGQLALSIPSEYLGEVDHMTESAAVEVARALVEVRQTLGLPAVEASPSPPLPKLLSTPSRLEKGLERAGFTDIACEVFEHPWSTREYLDWMGQPVVVGNMLPGAHREQHKAFLDALAERVAPDAPLRARWFLVTARRS